MASIGYNQGYYSRSKYNDLAHQAEATTAAVSNVTATSVRIKPASVTIAAVSNLNVIGTQIDLSLIHI